MHPNPIFKRQEKENIAFARSRGFGMLTINADEGPLISHIPFVLSEDGAEAEFHLVRSNPILRQLNTPQQAVLAITGGDAYISPDWYKVEDQVPTWNYVAVHLRGELALLPLEDINGVLSRISETMETRLLPKKPWTSDKMTPDVYLKMQRQIVPVRLRISGVDGTWKLSQNKPEEVRQSAADGLEADGFGSEVDEIVRLMRLVGS